MTAAKHILVVDDEPNLTLSLSYLLRAEGYSVDIAHSSAEALRLAHSHPPDLAVLDVILPGDSGYDLCQKLRGDESYGDPRIIFLTARSREVDRDKGLALGADAYLSKPFAIDHLRQSVRDLLTS